MTGARTQSVLRVFRRKEPGQACAQPADAGIRQMAKQLKAGDKVAWETSQGETHGKVVRKQTSPTKIKSHKVAASPSNPEYIVKSDKSGKIAAHKPSGLRKLSG